MKTSKILFGMALVGMTAAACSVKTKTTGSSGAGGDSSTSTSTSTVTGPTTTTTTTSGVTTTSTSSGGSGCDSGSANGSFDAPECQACVQCAAQSTCASETASCGQGSECFTFDDCRVACIDSADANNNMEIDDGAETTEFYKCFGLDETSGMPDPALTDSCVAKSPQGYQDWNAWINCIYGDCEMDCGTGGGGGGTPICDSGLAVQDAACGQCLSDNCCAEIKACADDADCNKCITGQDMAACDKTMLDEPADGCFANKCGTECGA